MRQVDEYDSFLRLISSDLEVIGLARTSSSLGNEDPGDEDDSSLPKRNITSFLLSFIQSSFMAFLTLLLLFLKRLSLLPLRVLKFIFDVTLFPIWFPLRIIFIGKWRPLESFFKGGKAVLGGFRDHHHSSRRVTCPDYMSRNASTNPNDRFPPTQLLTRQLLRPNNAMITVSKLQQATMT